MFGDSFVKSKTAYVLSKHTRRKKRGKCEITGKIKYPSKHTAAIAMHVVEGKKERPYEEGANVYHCAGCEAFHWGHMRKK